MRIANQYVVGAGSQLNDCDKEWCDECATDDGGRYTLNDSAIAEISAEQLVDVLRRDPAYVPSDGPEEQETRERPETDADNEDILAYAFNESDDAKLRRLWNGDYSDYGGDRSAAEAALAANSGGGCRATRRPSNARWTATDYRRVSRFRASRSGMNEATTHTETAF